MISRVRAKRWIVQLIVVLGALGALGLVVATGRLVLQYGQGADSASALHEVATLPADVEHLVRWEPDAWTRDRQLEPANRTLVEAAYIRAWAALGHLQTTGSDDALTDTFTARARTSVLAVPRDERVATWDLGHELTLRFYALDGGTIAFSDADATLARTVRVGDAETVLITHERYDVVMALVDGYWRIDQLRRDGDSGVVTVRTTTAGDAVRTTVTGADPRSPVDAPPFRAAELRPDTWDATTGLDGAGAAVPSAGASTVAAAAAVEITAADPVVKPDGRWTPGEAGDVRSALQRAADLGLTAVRVPLDYAALGGADPTDAALDNVTALFREAESLGIGVVPVLFDGLADLSPSTWAGADRHLQQLVSTVRDSPALVAWDLMDGPAARTANGASATDVRAFLVLAATRLHGLDPATPVTVSWHDLADATDPAMVGLVDMVSLQVDGMSADDITAAVARLTAAAGGRPLSLVTTGPATDGGWSPFPRTVHAQAATLDGVLVAARSGGIGRVSTAAVRDSAVTGLRGVLAADGTPKPAAALLGPDATLGTVPSGSLGDYLGARLWQAAVVLLVVAVAMGALGRRRRLRRRPAAASNEGEQPASTT